MEEILTIRKLNYSLESYTLFEAASLQLKSNEVVGIIGKNGAGKSTLLKIIEGKLQPTAGTIDWKKSVQLEVVEQEQSHYDHLNLSAYERELLAKFSVPLKDYHYLSGGEKLKARLAKGFSKSAQLLLLDEPTNHLDEDSIQLLLDLIHTFKGTIIMVSHDRYFLDQVTTKIWSIEDQKIMEFEGNYSAYISFREDKRQAQQHAYNMQQKRVKQVESQMQNLTSWSEKAHRQSTKQEGFKEFYRAKAKRMDTQVKSKRKKLEKELEKSRIEQVQPEYMVKFSLPPAQKKGRRLIELKEVRKSFDNKILFEHVNLTIQSGDKIALVGPNGCGKTTLLNMIMGKEAVEGDCWVSPAVNIGYLTQNVFDLPLKQTLDQFFYKETFEERGKVQNLMKHLGFHAQQWNEPIESLSMGERIKCKLMQYILEAKDLLILDEPTNHLDLPSREQLEQTLKEYNGTILVVSHDRYFIDKITNKTWIVANERVQTPIVEKKGNDSAVRQIQLETEQQEILGKLSLLSVKDEKYKELDKRFNEIVQELRDLKS